MAWSGNWSDIRLQGGALCLNFTNTIHDRTVGPPEDYLKGFDDLLRWLTLTNALPPTAVRNMKRTAGSRPGDAMRAFAAAVNVRELLYRIFSAIARGEGVSPADMACFNEQVDTALRHERLVQKKGHFSLEWDLHDGELGQALWPIVKSAMDLLLSDNLGRVKLCPRCRWLFLDTSKNGLRRWCSMDTCGSIDKSLRYYYRWKAPSGPNTR